MLLLQVVVVVAGLCLLAAAQDWEEENFGLRVGRAGRGDLLESVTLDQAAPRLPARPARRPRHQQQPRNNRLRIRGRQQGKEEVGLAKVELANQNPRRKVVKQVETNLSRRREVKMGELSRQEDSKSLKVTMEEVKRTAAMKKEGSRASTRRRENIKLMVNIQSQERKMRERERPEKKRKEVNERKAGEKESRTRSASERRRLRVRLGAKPVLLVPPLDSALLVKPHFADFKDSFVENLNQTDPNVLTSIRKPPPLSSRSNNTPVFSSPAAVPGSPRLLRLRPGAGGRPAAGPGRARVRRPPGASKQFRPTASTPVRPSIKRMRIRARPRQGEAAEWDVVPGRQQQTARQPAQQTARQPASRGNAEQIVEPTLQKGRLLADNLARQEEEQEVITVSPVAHVIRYTLDQHEVTSAAPVLPAGLPLPADMFSQATHALLRGGVAPVPRPPAGRFKLVATAHG